LLVCLIHSEENFIIMYKLLLVHRDEKGHCNILKKDPFHRTVIDGNGIEVMTTVHGGGWVSTVRHSFKYFNLHQFNKPGKSVLTITPARHELIMALVDAGKYLY